MLTKKQLEDAARCAGHCSVCSMDNVEGCCIEVIAQTALAHRKILEQLEWVYNGGFQECPWCQNAKGSGHTNYCELAALLKESEVEHDA